MGDLVVARIHHAAGGRNDPAQTGRIGCPVARDYLGRTASGSQQFRGAGQAHGEVLHTAIGVVAQFSCLQQLPDESL